MSTIMFDRRIVPDAEDALEFLDNILASSTGYSIVAQDLDGKILLWNEGARRLYGHEPEEVVGKAQGAILYLAEDVAQGKPSEYFQTALREGMWEGTTGQLDKDGRRFETWLTVTPRRDRRGQPIGFLLMSRELSAESRNTGQREATELYIRWLIESNFDPLLTTDPSGVITYVNEPMLELTGYRCEDLIARLDCYSADPHNASDVIKQVLGEGR